MADLTEMKMNEGYTYRNPVGQFTSSGANIAHDVVELAELQAKLFKAELRGAVERSTTSMALGVMSLAAGLASLPVVALGIASGLSAGTGMSLWISQLIVGVLLLLVCASLLWIAARNINKSLGQFRRSFDEMGKNVAWIKQVIRGQSTDDGSSHRDRADTFGSSQSRY